MRRSGIAGHGTTQSDTKAAIPTNPAAASTARAADAIAAPDASGTPGGRITRKCAVRYFDVTERRIKSATQRNPAAASPASGGACASTVASREGVARESASRKDGSALIQENATASGVASGAPITKCIQPGVAAKHIISRQRRVD